VRAASTSQEHQRTPHEITYSDDLDFGNANGVDSHRNGSYLLLLTHFHASPLSHFSFVDRLAPSVSVMRTAPQSNGFQTNPIQFEQVKVSQLK
jgi:hypothetical protein